MTAELLRHAQAQIARGAQRAQRHAIVLREDRGGRLFALHQVQQGLMRRGGRPVAFDDQAGVDFDLRFLQGCSIAGDAILRAVFDQRAGDHRDAFMPQPDEMLHRRSRRALIVERHRIHVQPVTRMSADEDHGKIFGQRMCPVVDVGIDHQHALRCGGWARVR